MLAGSIVIASRNGARTLGDTLDGLIGQARGGPWEIVLADNGSTDGTRALFEAVASRHPSWPMRVVDASAQVGKGFALNAAIRASAARKLLVVDDDDVPAPGWLQAMDGALDRHAFVHAAREWRRLNPEWAVASRSAEPEDWRYWRPPYARLAAGGAQGFRREVFDAVGGFDEEAVALEDLCFCIAAHGAGHELVFVPEAVIRYRLRADVEAIFRQQMAYSYGAARLRRLYPTGSPLGGPVKILLLATKLASLGVEGLARRLGFGAGDMRRTADYARRLEQASDDLRGSIAFRVAPDQPTPAALRRLVGWRRGRASDRRKLPAHHNRS